MRIRKRAVPLPLSPLSPISISTATDPTTSTLLSSAVQLPPPLPPSATSPAPQSNLKPKPPLLGIDLNQPCPYSSDLDELGIDINNHHRPLQLEEENEEAALDLRLLHDHGAAADSRFSSYSSPLPSVPADVEAPPPYQDDDDYSEKGVGTDDNDDGDNKDGERMPEAECEVEDGLEPKEVDQNNKKNILYESGGCTDHRNNSSKDNMVSAKADDSCRNGPAQQPPPPTGSSTHEDDVHPDHTITSSDEPEPVVASPTMRREWWCPDGDKTIPLKKRRSSFDIYGEEMTSQGMVMMKSKTNKKSQIFNSTPLIGSSNTDSRALALEEEDDCKPPPASGDQYYVNDNGREEDNNTTNVMWVDIDANGDCNTNNGGNDHQSCTSTSNHKLSASSTTTIRVCNNATRKTTRKSNNDINTTTIAANGKTENGSSAGSGGGAKRRKKGKRSTGAVIMQGSRCSRVNGRGWRCCQPTLVGYSLCDHHLGKGKVRSMSTGRSRGATSSNLTTTATTTSLSASTLLLSPLGRNSRKVLSAPPDEKKMKKQQQQHGPSRKKKNNNNGVVVSVFSDDVEDDDDDDDDGGSKKRMKLGVVKARSLSSLLGQPNTMVVASTAPVTGIF